MTDALARQLADIVGFAHVLADPALTASYESDWTGRFSGRARLVVRPQSTQEVAAVLRACAQADAAVVPQGGNTGMVGGSVPRGGEVVLSLLRLAELGAVDELAGQVTVDAGATLAAAQARARAVGLDLAIDLGARDSATIGGVVATNAGGLHAFRYGMTRASVAGLEAVLADGSVLTRLSGLLKDNAGYDLPSLIVGSEGTLAVVTRVRLKLVPQLPQRATVLLALPTTEAAVALLRTFRASLPSLLAIELFYRSGLDLVCEHLGRSRPFRGDYPVYVLVECADQVDPLDELAAAIEASPDVLDTVVASDERDRAALWALRERHPDAIGTLGVPHKLDVSLPLASLPAFVDEVERRVARLGARTILYGHLADGNLHVNVLGPDPDDEAPDEMVLRLVAELGGSISAEHGVGVAKRRWLGLTRSAGELAAMRRIKQALDPTGILNPGVLL
jgi:FAD/FMN-containing dehydrogenase